MYKYLGMRKSVLIGSLILNLLFLAGIVYAVQSLGGWRYVWFKIQNRGVAGTYIHRTNLLNQFNNMNGKIVFLGDSLTELCEWNELMERTDILNRGISGDFTSGVLQRLPRILTNAPRQLFLMIGINDLAFTGPDVVIANYQKIVDRITQKAPSTKLYIQSILPVNNQVRNTGIANKDIQYINREISKMAARAGATFINLYPFFTNEAGRLKEGFTEDGIHLDAPGYLQWKEVLKDYLATPVSEE